MPADARSARGLERRRQIVAAATALFAAQGYHAPSLRDIAAASDISHAGLLRHYASKAEILRAVFETVAPTAAHAPARSVDDEVTSLFAYAAMLPVRPGLVTLIATAYACAADPDDPMHEYMLGRMLHRAASGERHQRARADLGRGRDPQVESRLFGAAWDGLQLLMLYCPETIDFPTQIRRFYDDMTRDRVAPSTGLLAPTAQDAVPEAPLGRREAILAGALALFARTGYADSTMRDIAEAGGVAKSTLFHHFASKEEILRAALEMRDGEVRENLPRVLERSAREALLLVAARAGDTARARVENAAYVQLSHEASPLAHPEHAYFAGRFAEFRGLILTLLSAAQEQGSLAPDRDPAYEATILVALWSGVQLQHLYEPEVVDAASLLQDHIRGLLHA